MAKPPVHLVQCNSAADPAVLNATHSVQEGKSDSAQLGTKPGQAIGTKDGALMGAMNGLPKGTMESETLGTPLGLAKGGNLEPENGTKLGQLISSANENWPEPQMDQHTAHRKWNHKRNQGGSEPGFDDRHHTRQQAGFTNRSQQRTIVGAMNGLTKGTDVIGTTLGSTKGGKLNWVQCWALTNQGDHNKTSNQAKMGIQGGHVCIL